jgi:hypothetical protein
MRTERPNTIRVVQARGEIVYLFSIFSLFIYFITLN